ncbi:hypothetical protein ABPG77_008530 [Micractinium sp. CCAP 211/92]
MRSRLFGPSLTGCVVYVSEAHNAALLSKLEAAATNTPGTALANLFADAPYNRTAFTLVGAEVPALASAAVGLARAALETVDMRSHAASHPRLGVVDHISCHPLPTTCQQQDGETEASAQPAAHQQASTRSGAAEAQVAAVQQQQQQQQEAAVALARTIALQLGAGPHAVPVYTYAWVHPRGQPLAQLRRELGYFKGAAASTWQGGLHPAPGGAAGAAAARAAGGTGDSSTAVPLPLAPCFGPTVASARSGVCCVGASPWIVNFNVMLHTEDMAAARAVAHAVSERGGGLQAVQAMALRHEAGIEVACNLLDPAVSPPHAVLAEVQRLASAAGLRVGRAYRTNKLPGELAAAAAAAGL